jgi:hypothetical protein
MAVQLLQVAAIQMDDAAAFLAPQQKAVVVRRVGAVLVKSALLRGDPVDMARLLQLFQLAVNGGKPHGAARLTQLLRDLAGGQRFAGTLFQAAEDRLVLFGGIRHICGSLVFYKMRIILIS